MFLRVNLIFERSLWKIHQVFRKMFLSWVDPLKMLRVTEILFFLNFISKYSQNLLSCLHARNPAKHKKWH